MRNKLFKILILPLATLLMASQSLESIKVISIKSDFITSDNLGNVYIVKGEELSKYDSNGDLFQRYSSKRYGKISAVDVSNPLKILVFYKDFSIVLFLDDMLAETGNRISLTDFSLEQASLTCTSHNSCFWIYDPISFQLIRINQYLNKIQQTGNLVQQLSMPLNPNFLLESNNWVYLNNPESGILVFDIYGTYSKLIPLKGLRSFQVIDNKIFYSQNDKIESYDIKTLEKSMINLPDSAVINARLGDKMIYIQKELQVGFYKYKKD